ncbi:TorD/DmsD family molecular chaperone [Neobacillus drentensis]|uniref:TorD/DmsD family molecular chaperone n=1 Tax=Neobacillus drentensis TaxID=220684 RepID=UPI00285B1B71|nr:molecular chaperone TorD family protein [Neobacillus drentensis]MDR7239094.1 TorA maturation chaperone TorD [Neobacillus drentensis]
MESQVKVNEEEVRYKQAIYLFLQKFYAGDLNKLTRETWVQLSSFLSQETSYFSNGNMKQGTEILSELNDSYINELEYEFNRLFVGPKRLEASPYESTYRNSERALMQGDTLAVRRFYEHAGLAVSRKNIDPDDHLALELEFVCHLLSNSVEEEDCFVLYQEFLKQHLFHWVEEHCELIRERTENTVLIGISYLLQGLMEVERKQLNIQRRLKK